MTSAPAPIQRMIDATNAGDHDAFLATFTADAVLVDWGKEFSGTDSSGTDSIAAWDESDNIGRKAHFRVADVEKDGDAWLVTLDVTGAGFNGTGNFRFMLTDDLIARMEITP
ncbi:MAG: nuclear transport factor 2 family protein [Pseudolysinimonas sp.]